MKKTLKWTPAKPCCDTCVLQAMTTAGFDYTVPFVVLSGAAGQSKRTRAALVESLLNTDGEVFVIVSPPVAETEEVSETPDPGEAASLDEKAMCELLGVEGENPDEANH